MTAGGGAILADSLRRGGIVDWRVEEAEGLPVVSPASGTLDEIASAKGTLDGDVAEGLRMGFSCGGAGSLFLMPLNSASDISFQASLTAPASVLPVSRVLLSLRRKKDLRDRADFLDASEAWSGLGETGAGGIGGGGGALDKKSLCSRARCQVSIARSVTAEVWLKFERT